MSYILDALRKSDQQRQRGAVPTTLTAQAPLLASKRPAVSLNALLALVLIGAGILIGWLRPWQQAVPAPETLTMKSPAASPHLAAPAPLQKSAAAAQSAYPSGGNEVKLDAPALARAAPPHTPSEAGVAKDAAPEQGVLALSELPASIRQEIPRLSISLHSYASDPKDRLVMINNMMLRQGESLAPGLSMERITPSGVIISYKNYRFHHGMR